LKKRTPSYVVLEGHCPGSELCPLTKVKAGQVVCIKQLVAKPETVERLRELGFGEEQKIRLLSSDSSYICQVCNARLGISPKLAEAILVQPLAASEALA